jgi:hypothetical protein
MTPYVFTKSLDSFNTGDIGFCEVASISTGDDHTTDNIGFWFEVIENEQQPVLSVKMDSFTIDRPVTAIVIAGKDHLLTYIKNVRRWAEYELMSYFSLCNLSHRSLRLEHFSHSQPA